MIVWKHIIDIALAQFFSGFYLLLFNKELNTSYFPKTPKLSFVPCILFSCPFTFLFFISYSNSSNFWQLPT